MSIEADTQCPICGQGEPCKRFENQTFQCGSGETAIMVPGLSGWHCARSDDDLFDPECAKVYAAVGDALVYRARSKEKTNVDKLLTRWREEAHRILSRATTQKERERAAELERRAEALYKAQWQDKYPDAEMYSL